MGLLGYKHTPEAREKIRLAGLGRKLSPESRKLIGEKNKLALTGKKFTEERRLKHIQTVRRGCNHPDWKGGVVHNRVYRNMILKKWRYKNPLRVKAYQISRRNTCKVLPETIQLVYEDNIKRYGTLTCYLCHVPINFGNDHVEHRIPLSRGGTNDYNNLSIACKSCNCSKNTKTEEEYAEYKRRKDVKV